MNQLHWDLLTDGKLDVEAREFIYFSDPTNTVPNQTATNIRRYASSCTPSPLTINLLHSISLTFLSAGFRQEGASISHREQTSTPRFLYNRFPITYLNAKKSQNTAFTSTVDAEDQYVIYI